MEACVRALFEAENFELRDAQEFILHRELVSPSLAERYTPKLTPWNNAFSVFD